MAKLKSFLKIQGTVGGMSFVKRNGEIYVRESTGINGDVIKTDPRFERTRENMQEFANIIAAAKLMKMACNNLAKNAKDGALHNRLTQLFALIKNLDATSVRGQRTVGLGITNPGVSGFLRNFDFNKRSSLQSVLNAPYTVNLSTGEFSVSSLVPGDDLMAPAGATHVRMMSGFLKIDFSGNVFDLKLSPATTLPLNSIASAVSLVPASVPTLGSSNADLYLVKIEFGQEINGIYYPLRNGEFNCLQITEVQ